MVLGTLACSAIFVVGLAVLWLGYSESDAYSVRFVGVGDQVEAGIKAFKPGTREFAPFSDAMRVIERLRDLYRQNVAHRLVETTLEYFHDTRALHRIGEAVLARRCIDRELLLDECEMTRIFVSRDSTVGGEAELRAKAAGKAISVRNIGFGR